MTGFGASPVAHARLAAVGRLLARLGEASSRRPLVVLLVALVVVIGCGLVAARSIRVDTDASGMLSSELPHRQRELAFNRVFPGLNTRLVVLVDAPDADRADAFLTRLLSEIGKRPQHLKDPFAASVDPYFLRNGLLYKDDAELDSFLARLSRAGPLLATLASEPTLEAYFAALAEGVIDAERIAGGEETLVRVLKETDRTIAARLEGQPRQLAFSSLFSEDGNSSVRRVLTVEPKLDYSRLQPARPAIAALSDAIAAADPGRDQVRVAVTGDPAMRSEEFGSVLSGIGVSLAVSLVALSALLWFAYRNIRLSLLTLSIVILANSVAAAFASLAFPALNLVSMAFAVLLTGVGADFAVHFILHARQPGASIANALQRLGPALFLCALSTMAGFLAFVPTPFVGMTQLGLIGAVGVLTAFVATVIVIPAGLRLVPASKLPSGGFSGLPAMPPLLLPMLAGGLLVAALILAPRARFETDPVALRDPGSPAVIAYGSLFAERETRPYSASILVATPEEAEAVAQRLEALPEVDRVVTPARLLPGEDAVYRFDAIDAVAAGLLPQLAGGEAPVVTAGGLARLKAALGRDRRPESRALLERLEALERAGPEAMTNVEADILHFWPTTLERLRTSLTPELEPDLPDLPPVLLSRYRAADGQIRVEVVPAKDLRDPAARKAFVAAVRGIAPEAAGPVMNLEDSGAVIERAMLTATATALLLCGLLLLAVDRSVWRTIATLLPIVAACILTLGGSVLFQLPFNYANVIALPMLIGAGIDSAIHMAASADESGHAAGGPTPRAIIVTALTTITSFGSLILSDHRGVASIGGLLLIALASTTFAALVLEPPLLRIAARLNRRRA